MSGQTLTAEIQSSRSSCISPYGSWPNQQFQAFWRTQTQVPHMVSDQLHGFGPTLAHEKLIQQELWFILTKAVSTVVVLLERYYWRITLFKVCQAVLRSTLLMLGQCSDWKLLSYIERSCNPWQCVCHSKRSECCPVRLYRDLLQSNQNTFCKWLVKSWSLWTKIL